MKKRVMIMAGELSGDMHAAYLVEAIRRRCPDCTFTGIGGMRMRAAGVDILQDIVGKSTIGMLGNLAVVALNFAPLLKMVKKIKRMFTHYKPDVLVLVDNQGLNMFIAGIARTYQIKTLYYIPPQEWLWGSREGGLKVAKTVDKVVAILEQEYDFYRQLAPNALYFGHPLLDIIPEHYQRDPGKKKESRLIGLFPGSRKNEIHKLSPILRQLAEYIYAHEPDVRFRVAISDPMYAGEIRRAFGDPGFPVEFDQTSSLEVIASSQLVIGASGTLALECAILHTPMVVLYKLPQLDYFFIKNIMRIRVDFISLPNIILGERVMPEFIQGEISPERIYTVVKAMLDDPQFAQAFEGKITQVCQKLGTPGVLDNVAEAVLSL